MRYLGTARAVVGYMIEAGHYGRTACQRGISTPRLRSQISRNTKDIGRSLPPVLKRFGGRYVVRRGDPEVLEGDRDIKLVVVLEFETRERAVEWYNSAQYQAAKAIRLRGANTNAVLLSGYEGS
jgi:uncharacterized protein (DUF1330 family)